jgi:hypothetical protein
MIKHYQHKLEALPLNPGIEDKEEEKMRSLKDLLWSTAMAEPRSAREGVVDAPEYNPCS